MVKTVVELHVPLHGTSEPPAGGPSHPWIDVIEDFLAHQVGGEVEVYDDGEELGDVFVFFIAGGDEHELLSAASQASVLPGVPKGAFAMVTDDAAEEFGQGRRVELPIPQSPVRDETGIPATRGADTWLDGGLEPVGGGEGAVEGFSSEVNRVIAALTTNPEWRAWWHGASDAPRLEVHMLSQRLPRNPAIRDVMPEVVRRGKNRHYVRMDVDITPLLGIAPDERRLLALPAVLEGIRRIRESLNLPEPPEVPPAAHPAPLSDRTLRRRKLRLLLAKEHDQNSP